MVGAHLRICCTRYLRRMVLCRNVSLFANTDMPQTIDFVQMSSRWEVPITCRQDENKVGYKVVNHNSCSMKGEPFEKLVYSKRYLPNVMTRFCTEELKVRTMKRYLVNELGWKKWSSAIGIRHECRKESKDRWVFWYPLVLKANKQFQSER